MSETGGGVVQQWISLPVSPEGTTEHKKKMLKLSIQKVGRQAFDIHAPSLKVDAHLSHVRALGWVLDVFSYNVKDPDAAHLHSVDMGPRMPNRRKIAETLAGLPSPGVELNERERAAILCGLRDMQQFYPPIDPQFLDIATSGGKLKILSMAEIDTLCEKLNPFGK